MAGLVGITPACGFVGLTAALIIGIVAGVLCYFAIVMKTKLGYDDSLDVVGIHGVGGAWGALATGLFADKAINAAGANGLFFGNPGQLGIQALSVIVTIGYAFIMSLIILKALDWIMGLRVSPEDEVSGLDLTQHNETAYNL